VVDLHRVGVTRRVGVRAWMLGAAGLLVLCQGCPTGTPTQGPRPLGGLVVRCQPADAMVYVDDHLEGSASSFSRRPLALALGFHRVEMRREGYFPHFAEVTLVAGGHERLEVQLRREPF
jgi:hypothetical protein